MGCHASYSSVQIAKKKHDVLEQSPSPQVLGSHKDTIAPLISDLNLQAWVMKDLRRIGPYPQANQVL